MSRADEMATYGEQKDVDLAFADYDRAQLIVNPRPVPDLSATLPCISCGSTRYTYNHTGSNDAGTRICHHCGVVQPGSVIYEQMFGHTVGTRTSNYKRIHHWHERISQFMLMESQIPAEHMLAIGEKLLDGTYTVLSKDTIRTVLRSLGLQTYIEKWLQIIQRCTGVMPPCPGPVVLNRLDELFIELQRPFNAHKNHTRRNFLNYNYVFCRLFQRMNCSKFCMFFPLIRSKPKLRALDEMWNGMASSLGWPTPPLEQVVPFSVRIDSPAALLAVLKLQLATSAQAVPRADPMRMAIQKWGRQLPQAEDRFARAALHSLRPERRPQTLALRLKRKRSAQA